jgi:uncharacterized damage-inducible protein DinB
MNALLELFRHKTWATIGLIELCQSLAPETLETTIPGTYGTVHATIQHLVDADAGYFRTVTGERPYGPFSEPIPLAELADHFRRLGPRWEEVIQDPRAHDREVTTLNGWRMTGAIPMTQAIHHSEEHRTQVQSILGANGIELPELAVWGYAKATGLMELIDPSD